MCSAPLKTAALSYSGHLASEADCASAKVCTCTAQSAALERWADVLGALNALSTLSLVCILRLLSMHAGLRVFGLLRLKEGQAAAP